MAYWDDTDSLFGDVRLYKLQYYLSDDTMEVVEVLPRNCGRDPFPKFLRRMRLPRDTPMTGSHPVDLHAPVQDPGHFSVVTAGIHSRFLEPPWQAGDSWLGTTTSQDCNARRKWNLQKLNE